MVKLFVCLASTLSLLGGALAFQQPKRAPARDAAPSAQSQTNANAGDRVGRPTSDPYTGSLSIFEDPKREEKLQINRVMDLLKIKEGSGVADIGAGSGWFTVRAARRVGSTGAVYAVDINRDYLNYIEERAQKEGLPQVRAILGKEDDPLLPARSADAVLILKTYHEIAEPVRLMRNLRAALREGATVGIIDRNGRGDDHGLDQSVVVKEVERAGYRLVESYDFVKPDGMDYFLIFSVSR
ncbi:MAG: class I SAM-dependent methyltransferase [Acidobacteria bacterium]|nr:class I SAM-dependent methyltransferase [Acidobacteriota bacterium]